MKYNIGVRNKLKEIPKVSTFEELVESSTLSDTDKEILYLHYLKGQELSVIADKLGYSESGIKKRHKQILIKIGKLL